MPSCADTQLYNSVASSKLLVVVVVVVPTDRCLHFHLNLPTSAPSIINSLFQPSNKNTAGEPTQELRIPYWDSLNTRGDYEILCMAKLNNSHTKWKS
jgi:hypothetical protein